MCHLFRQFVNSKWNITLFAVVLSLSTFAQKHNLATGLEYMGELEGIYSSGAVAPFWFSANKFGLSTIKPNSGYLRGRLERAAENDSAFKWKYGYGVDLAVPVEHTRSFYLQQLYAIVQYKNFRMTVGQKEIPQDMLNNDLSTGGLTLSNNASPIPQIRFELPKWWELHFTKDWVSLKGHLAYGFYTDGTWQQGFVKTGQAYTKGSFFHSKAGYLRIGNERKFPLSATLGIVMACQFGGYGYNIMQRTDSYEILGKTDLGNRPKDFWNAFIAGGSDVNDGNYANVAGNQVGNWYLDLKWQGKGWSVKAYAQHYFEDHSQLFMQYNWRDMLWGIEAQLPKNPIVSNLVVEYLRTDDQSGGIYHDQNDLVKEQISGNDNYYNHHIYGCWQHWGQVIGTPMVVSPIYNHNTNGVFSPDAQGYLKTYFNRLRACHLGFQGDPMSQLHYRILYSHLTTWGTYAYPTLNPQKTDYLLAELTYKPKQLKGWSFTAAYGLNTGTLLNTSNGCCITIRKTGRIGK